MPTKNEFIQDLQAVASALGETPTATQYNDRGQWHSGTGQYLFDTWNNALSEAGLDINQRRATGKGESYFIDDLQRVSEIVDRVPRRGDVDEHGEHNPTTYQQRLPYNDEKSRWSVVLREAGFEPYWEIKDTRTAECEVCGEEFEVKEYRNERRFCSTACHGKWRQGRFVGEENWCYDRQSVDCAWCGEALERIPYFIKNNDRHFCDDDCQGRWISKNNRGEAHPKYKGGKIAYGMGWSKEKKESVRERDGYKCQACGKTQEEELRDNDRRLSVHHLVPARKFDDPGKRNAKSNLVTLCHRHHMIWEGIPVKPQLVSAE